jgi:tetratricopeptide (TPR) repeat protein
MMKPKSTFNRSAMTAFLLVLVLAAGCSKDPAKRRSQFEANAKKYVQEEKYNEAIIEYRNALKVMPMASDLHLQLADVYMKNGQPREAFAEYKKAGELDPENRYAQLSLAKIYLVAGLPAETIQIATAQRLKHPDDADFGLILASAFAAKRDFQEGNKVLDEMLAKDPKNVAVLMHKGIFAVSSNKLEEARLFFERALAADPKSVDANNALAGYWLQKKDGAKAEEYFKAAIAQNPGSSAARNAYAQFLLRSGRGAEAEPVIKESVNLQKNSPAARMTLAGYYMNQGRTSEAKQVWEGIAKDHQQFLAARFELAEAALRDRNLDEAARIVDAIRKDKPKDSGALALHARILLGRGQANQAIEALEAAQKSDNRVPMIHFLLGGAYQQVGNLDRAQSSFEEALNLDPEFARARIALAQLLLSRGQADGALNQVNQVLDKIKNQPDALMMKGMAQIATRKFDNAEATFTELTKIVPNSDVVRLRLGQVAAAQKQPAVAEKHFRRAVELNPKQYAAIEGLVGLMLVKKDVAGAESFLQRQIANDNSAPLYMTLAQVYRVSNRAKDAETALLKAVSLDPHNTNAITSLGSLYIEHKSIDKALEQFATALKLDPKNIGVLTVSGVLNEQAGKKDIAKQFYEQALAIDPNAGLAANNLAFMLLTEGKDMDRALELARRARSSMPQVPAAADTLAWVYYKRNLHDSAFPLLQEAVKAQPENATYRFHLAAVLVGQGKKQQAKVEMDKALKLDSALQNDGEAKRVMSELAL